MNYKLEDMRKFTSAMVLASVALEDEVSCWGEPKIFELLELCLAVSDVELKLAAFMYGILPQEPALREEKWFQIESVLGAELADVAEALSIRIDEPYREFVRRSSLHPIARAIHIEAIKLVSGYGRLSKLSTDVIEDLRWAERYLTTT